MSVPAYPPHIEHLPTISDGSNRMAVHRQWYDKNRAKKLAQNRAWERRNAKWRRLYLCRNARQWYHSHPARARANTRRYYLLHRTQKNSRRNQQLKLARATNPGVRIRYNLRTRLATLLSKGGRKRFSLSRQVLLYTGDQLRAHLRRQFTRAMTWGNYGVYWEVDHRKPCADFDLTILSQCRRCFALRNLRPLPLKENRGRYNATRRNGATNRPRTTKITTPQTPTRSSNNRP